MVDKHATVTLRPNDVKTSDDGTVATNIKFKFQFISNPQLNMQSFSCLRVMNMNVSVARWVRRL